jgi:hypothetical protein
MELREPALGVERGLRSLQVPRVKDRRLRADQELRALRALKGWRFISYNEIGEL